jgi:hypothetical protein
MTLADMTHDVVESSNLFENCEHALKQEVHDIFESNIQITLYIIYSFPHVYFLCPEVAGFPRIIVRTF